MVRSGDGCECGRENGGVESGALAQVEALAEERAAWIRKRLVKLRSKRRRMAKELGAMASEERRLDVELRKLHSLKEGAQENSMGGGGAGLLSKFSSGETDSSDQEGDSTPDQSAIDRVMRAAKKRGKRAPSEPPPGVPCPDHGVRPV